MTMKHVNLSQELRNRMEEVIKAKSTKPKLNQIHVQEIIEKLSKINLFKEEMVTKLDKKEQKIFYTYHEMDEIALKQVFSNVKVVEEAIEYYNEARKVVYHICYDVVYDNDKQFKLYASYQLSFYKITAKDFFIEPYLWVESKVCVNLTQDEQEIWEKEYQYTIPENQYIEEVSKLDIMVVPNGNREYEIVTLDKGVEQVETFHGDFSNVLKKLFSLLIDCDDFETEKDFGVTCHLVEGYHTKADVVSDLVYNKVKIGEYTRYDMVFKYEITFGIEGINDHLKVYVYLTEDEYRKINKIGNYSLKDQCKVENIQMEESAYAGKIYDFVVVNYSKVTKMISQDRIRYENCIIEKRENECLFLKRYFSTAKPEVLEISDKNVPFRKLVFFKYVLEEKTHLFHDYFEDEKLQKYFNSLFDKIEIIKIGKEDIITHKDQEQEYLLNQFIVFTNENVIFTQSYSPIMQLSYTNNDLYKINLPILFSDKTYFVFQYLDSVEQLDKLMVGNLDSRSICDLDDVGIYHLYQENNISEVVRYLKENYESLFCNFTISVKKNVENLKRRVNEAAKLEHDFNLYEIAIDGKCDKNKICLKEPFVPWEEEEDCVKHPCCSLYVNGYRIGEYMTCRDDKTLLLELIGQNKEKEGSGWSNSDVFLSVVFDKRDLGCKITLYELLEESTRFFRRNDGFRVKKLDKTVLRYILTIFEKYENDNRK